MRVQMATRKYLPVRLAGCLSCAAILFANGCRPEESPPVPGVRPVKTMVVTAGDGERLRSFPGTVEASRRVELAFRVPGLLAELPVKEGQKVAKGDLIAQLRQGEFEARLKSLQGELGQARANLAALLGGERPEEMRRREAQVRATEARVANTRMILARNQQLITQRAVSQQELEKSELDYQVAQEENTAAVELLQKGSRGRNEDIEASEAQVRGLEGRVVEAQIQLDDSTLLAPYDGVIAQRFVDEGQNITPNTPVVQFQDLNEIDIVVDVPEAVMVGEIQLADIVDMSAEISSAPGVDFPVRIREVSQVADPVTQTFKIRAAMQSPENLRVLPGMTANVNVRYHRSRALAVNHIWIPIEAVGVTPAGEQVAWVFGEEDTVSRRPIKLGATAAGRIEIVEGLEPGDRIVVAGVRFLREGMKVRDLGDALGRATP
ncbi:Multidrug resistance protein MdtA precursor [Bythopirellula goksoeyrii]|uniref:Multidrug resistance protein MdtA n=2 Tax=Bythopirellula goksoeyrii TaxID=1400387 RepID=A0A5B9QN56_9BACT|nr:Multidrug resistance protein MdtA precursor [Bythopirellula goksoeyrii]